MHALIRTARTTGLFYLGLAITGVLGFVLIRSRLFAADDPAATLANLVEHESLARAGVALELLIVVTQALAAVWFYRLFRTADPLAAGGIAAFGLVNAVAILVSAALARDGGRDRARPDRRRGNDRPAPVPGQRQPVGRGRPVLRPVAHPHGLVRAPLGVDAAPLGWILVGGGIGYVLSAFVRYLAPERRPSPTRSPIPRPWASSG